MGTLGRRGARVASVLSRAVLLSLAARQPVVAGRADDGARRERARDGRHRGRVRAPGEPDVRDGAPRRRRSGSSARPAAGRLGARSTPNVRTRSSPHGPGGRGCRPARRGRRRGQAGGAAADVRALRRRARPVPPHAAAGLARRRRAPRELADERLGPSSRRRVGPVRRPARRLIESEAPPVSVREVVAQGEGGGTDYFISSSCSTNFLAAGDSQSRAPTSRPTRLPRRSTKYTVGGPNTP